MTRPRLLAVVGAAVLLTGCGSATPVASSAVRAEPVASTTTSTTCDQDDKPVVASIDPGSITTSSSSWPSGSTMAEIKKRGKLIVGVAGDVPLWGSRDPFTSKLGGFDIDVAKRVAQELGLDPNRDVEYKVVNFAGRMPALQDGTVDLVVDTMTITCARWFGGVATDTKTAEENYINFSTEYYRAGQKLLVRSDSTATKLSDLADETVCAAKGSTSLDTIEGQVANVEKVGDIGECLVLFQDGQVDAITSDDTILAGFAKQDPYAKVMEGDAISEVPYGIGTAGDATDLTQFVNVVLEKMRSDGTLDKLYTRWMGEDGGTRPDVPKAVYGRTATEVEQARG